MSDYSLKIDFLSVTIRGTKYPQQPRDGGYELAHQILSHVVSSLNCPSDTLPPSGVGQGRNGYAYSWQAGTIARCFTGHPVSPPFVEFTGAALDALRQYTTDDALVAYADEDVSRLDFAVDIPCETSPKEFLEYMRSKRKRARSGFDTASGQTEYIGSPKSDRRVRVYRYAPPHPRAHLLRVEFQLRGREAKDACAIARNRGIDAAVGHVASAYDFGHVVWVQRSNRIEGARTYRNDTGNASRLRFWYSTCVPVARELIEAGLLTSQALRESLTPTPQQ